jgi:hypothetical protein
MVTRILLSGASLNEILRHGPGLGKSLHQRQIKGVPLHRLEK